LFYDVWYVCGFSETKDTSAARGIMGLAVTLAQKLSLRTFSYLSPCHSNIDTEVECR